MNNTRFEFQLSVRRDGRTFATIYDDYWDNIDTAVYDNGHPDQVDLPAFRQLAAEIAVCKSGWYAIDVDDYPFGKATRLFQIPGRHLRYRYAR